MAGAIFVPRGSNFGFKVRHGRNPPVLSTDAGGGKVVLDAYVANPK
jgi:hypothetical protein